MVRFILRGLIAAAGLWVAARFIPGVTIVGWQTFVIAGLVLGLVNAIVRPIVTFFTLPITLVTLGLFLLVVNAAMVLLMSFLLHAFGDKHIHIGGLFNAVLVVVVVWVVSLVGNLVLGGEEDRR